MTDFEQHRLNRYIDDTQHRLLIIRQILRYPLTANQEAADTMARAAVALVDAIRQQIMIDSSLYCSCLENDPEDADSCLSGRRIRRHHASPSL